MGYFADDPVLIFMVGAFIAFLVVLGALALTEVIVYKARHDLFEKDQDEY